MKDFSLCHVDPYQTPEEFVKDHEKGYKHRYKAGVTCGTVGHRRKRHSNEHCWRCDLPFWQRGVSVTSYFCSEFYFSGDWMTFRSAIPADIDSTSSNGKKTNHLS
jgi:hypothetical protein